MTDRETAQGLIDRFQRGETFVRSPKLNRVPPDGAAALVDTGTNDEMGVMRPAFWRHNRWETALREPSVPKPTHWSQFAEPINYEQS
jgi:hypothetical protein